MATISERLRRRARFDTPVDPYKLMIEAADTIDELVAALDASNVQMRIWVSNNGDMVGALKERIDANEAALAEGRRFVP